MTAQTTDGNFIFKIEPKGEKFALTVINKTSSGFDTTGQEGSDPEQIFDSIKAAKAAAQERAQRWFSHSGELEWVSN